MVLFKNAIRHSGQKILQTPSRGLHYYFCAFWWVPKWPIIIFFLSYKQDYTQANSRLAEDPEIQF